MDVRALIQHKFGKSDGTLSATPLTAARGITAGLGNIFGGHGTIGLPDPFKGGIRIPHGSGFGWARIPFLKF